MPIVPAFPLRELKEHLPVVDRLTSFEDVAQWDSRATQLIAGSNEYLGQLGRHIESVARAQREERAKRPFLMRLLLGLFHSMQLGGLRAKLAQEKAAFRGVIEELQGAIDKTPDSKTEKKAMLDDLRLAKKELNLQKREYNAAMRDVRGRASARGAQVGAGLAGLLTSPTSRRYQRMAIRLDKEAALAAHKSGRDAIEQKIAVLDQHILWLERIK